MTASDQQALPRPLVDVVIAVSNINCPASSLIYVRHGSEASLMLSSGLPGSRSLANQMSDSSEEEMQKAVKKLQCAAGRSDRDTSTSKINTSSFDP